MKDTPSSASAVVSTEKAVSLPVPKRRMSRALFRLETIVPQETIICTSPAPHTGAWMSPIIDGHALPSTESGSPRLMKDR